ncbi:DNA-binding response regulator [Virgibacillus profundi]|uniref:DNA-binding response regulator n=1 Tax=Virgibacillus profundi TaxID=2024555 RepID=A0A2A2IH78_9BACI|nr:response regulator transcription factor [Virgibacillus profundi]PAV30676.1 DNA-binding response regulator [Virgibacillus profundi]PXY54848.1 DNA-binding response regulator [Virgibacillus profundi]
MRLLIVDDDQLVCQSLQLLLAKEEDIEVVNIAANGQAAIELCQKKLPDIILMDIQMPVMNGIESTKIIKEKWPSVHIMMLTTFQDEKNIRLALKAGAEGYLLKSTSIENMAQQVRTLKAGSTVLDADVLKTIMEPDRKVFEGLTERETDIVGLIAQGLSNKEIAEQLFLGVGTVRNTLSVILDKLEIRDRTQLAIYYWQRKQE